VKEKKGARQTGKTRVMHDLGKQCFDFTAEFNFDRTAELAEIFEKTKDVKRILKDLALFSNVPVIPGKTLIIFDEIQNPSRAVSTFTPAFLPKPLYRVGDRH